jgi:hypothetical protein
MLVFHDDTQQITARVSRESISVCYIDISNLISHSYRIYKSIMFHAVLYSVKLL